MEIPLVLPVLSIETIIHHACGYLLLTETVDRRVVSVDSRATGIIYRCGSVESRNIRSISIVRITDSVDITTKILSYLTAKSVQKRNNVYVDLFLREKYEYCMVSKLYGAMTSDIFLTLDCVVWGCCMRHAVRLPAVPLC